MKSIPKQSVVSVKTNSWDHFFRSRDWLQLPICHRIAIIHDWRGCASLKCRGCYILVILRKEALPVMEAIYLQVVAVGA